MFGLIVEFDVDVDGIQEFKDAIRENAASSVSSEANCLQFDVLQLGDDPSAFRLYEIYRDQASFEQHRTLPHTQAFLDKVKPFVRRQASHRLTLLDSFKKPNG